LITSPHNDQLKEIRKLAGRKWRDKLQRFVAEGEDLDAAAREAGYGALARFEAGKEVAPHVLAAVSQLGSGTRVLGVYAQRWVAPAPLCVCLWGVGDPGNVGTVLRSALAFGAGSVALGPGSADPYGHKAVRASMGAIFSVGVARVRSVDELPSPRIALVARAGSRLDESWGNSAGHSSRPGSIVVGAEREGLPEDVVAACEHVAHIPIASESLNAAMAATVALYELSRPGAGT
jgi:RNA methyltransferase, TrmH family